MLSIVAGCASRHEPPMARGKWIAINPTNFIPPTAVLYTKSKPISREIKTIQQKIPPQKVMGF
ncbi:MAG: hypothetical protein Q4G13_06350 [Moraxella sp.]|nr:hypothetical protein [Moraxella sp.]